MVVSKYSLHTVSLVICVRPPPLPPLRDTFVTFDCLLCLLSRLQKVQNWFSKHANVITCKIFFKLFIGYRSKPGYTTHCQLSPIHLLPISLTSSLCTPLPGSFVLLQTCVYFVSPMLKETQSVNTLSLTVLQSNGILSHLTSVTFHPCMPLTGR